VRREEVNRLFGADALSTTVAMPRAVTTCLVDGLSSVADSRGPAFVVHVEGCDARRRLFIRALAQAKHPRLNALPAVQFARSFLVESRSIAISF